MQATPSAGRQPRFALSAYVGSYVHPAYGNATLSMSVDAEDGKVIGGHRPRSSTLQLCGAVRKACAIVSVLEGGYGTLVRGDWNRNTLSHGCTAHVEALCNHTRTRQAGHKSSDAG